MAGGNVAVAKHQGAGLQGGSGRTASRKKPGSAILVLLRHTRFIPR